MGAVIDGDVLIADFRFGEPSRPSAVLKRDAGGDHVGGDDGIAGLDPKTWRKRAASGPAESRPGKSTEAKRYCSPGAASRMTWTVPAGKARSAARRRHRNSPGCAEAPREVCIGARSPIDLGGVGRVLAIGLERGLWRNAVRRSSALSDGIETLDRQAVSRRGRALGSCICSEDGRPFTFRSGQGTPRSGMASSGAEGSRSVGCGAAVCGCSAGSMAGQSGQAPAPPDRRLLQPCTAAARTSALQPTRSSTTGLRQAP